jgi:hypothetical protein
MPVKYEQFSLEVGMYLHSFRKFDEAETLKVQVKETMNKTLREKALFHLKSMAN